jgi:Ca2+-binding EF-hand superfamily protein
MDTDGNGKVSKSEFETMLSKTGSTSSSSTSSASDISTLDDMFSQIDTDGDGSISQSEDETWWQKISQGGQQGPPPADSTSASSLSSISSSASSSLMDLFSTVDSNGDGTISDAEEQAYISSIQSMIDQMKQACATYAAQDTTSATASTIDVSA